MVATTKLEAKTLYQVQKVVDVPESNEKKYFFVRLIKKNLTTETIFDVKEVIAYKKYMARIREIHNQL